jgi:hypothetical protein
LPSAEIEALIAQAEAELAILKLREQRNGGTRRDPSDPAGLQRCPELWLAASTQTARGFRARTGKPDRAVFYCTEALAGAPFRSEQAPTCVALWPGAVAREATASAHPRPGASLSEDCARAVRLFKQAQGEFTMITLPEVED